MAEPVPALDDTQPLGDEEAARQWADEEAAKAGRIWAARWFPAKKDW